MSATPDLLEEVFLESDYDDAAQAMVARRQRAEQLQAQGLDCEAENCCRVTDGIGIFILKAQKPELVLKSEQAHQLSHSARPKLVKQRARLIDVR